MNILAIIPARAGSKGVPNKNIRLLGQHPLVYYSIKNALQSKYITDVIISTDSNPVRIIAQQMGAKVHWRDAELAGDEVTLDAVIYDAIPTDKQWDYVITMQPTSPTLTVGTLDSAIEYAIKSKLDTLISAINAPHLSWGEKDGKKIPNYEKRLNRQYLPPCYMETGAFVISKADIVTESTRIGVNVDVYEIPERESQDIDTFADLCSAAALLEAQKIAIYVNGNNKRGIGHIYRALEIADEFYVKPDVYYDVNQTDVKVFGNTTHNLIPVNGIAELYEICKREQYSLFVNDILTTSIDYMIGLRSVLPNAKLINFEDDGEGILKADLVKEDVNRVFIAFGGADPQNYTDRLLDIISKDEYKKYEFVVVVGRAKYNVDALLEYNKYEHIQVLYDVSNMPELMSSCDIAITSRGRTGYELALLGIPSIAMAQNQREEKHGFVCNENGFSYIGLNPSDEIIEGILKMYMNLSKEAREKLHGKLLSHNLRDGRKRVMSLIRGL